MLTRREFLSGAALATGSLALLKSSAFALTKKVKVGVLAPSHCALPLLLAQTRGMFKEAGVNAEVVFKKGMPQIAKGLSTGEIDFGQLTTPLVFAINAGNPGLPNMSLSAVQTLGINGGVLAASRELDIKTIVDLKGKRVGVHSPLIVHSVIFNLLLEKSGLDPEKDIEVEVIPMGEMKTALAEGRVDAIVNPEPLPTVLERKGATRTLLLTKTFWVDHPCCLLTFKKDLLDKDRNLVADVTRVSMAAGLTLDDKAKRSMAIKEIHASFAPYEKMPLPVLLEAFGPGRSDFYPFPYTSSGEVIASQMSKLGLLKEEPAKLVEGTLEPGFALEMMRSAVKEVPGSKLPSGLSRQEKISVI